VYVDVGAVTLRHRGPAACVHRLPSSKFQDRIIFGKDAYQPEDIVLLARVRDETTTTSIITAAITRSGSCTVSVSGRSAEKSVLQERVDDHAAFAHKTGWPR